MGQRRVVHVRLPCDPEGHLPVEVPLLEERGGRLGAEDLVEGLLLLEAGAHVVDVADEGLVEDVALGGLDAHGAHEDDAMQSARRHGRHLGGDPSPEAEPDYGNLGQIQGGDQRLIGDGDIPHVPHPAGPLRAVIAGMRGDIHGEPAREDIVEGQPLRAPDLVMQHEHGIARPTFANAQQRSRHAHLVGRPRHVGCGGR